MIILSSKELGGDNVHKRHSSVISGYMDLSNSTHINLPQYESLNVSVREMRDNDMDYIERIQLHI